MPSDQYISWCWFRARHPNHTWIGTHRLLAQKVAQDGSSKERHLTPVDVFPELDLDAAIDRWREQQSKLPDSVREKSPRQQGALVRELRSRGIKV